MKRSLRNAVLYFSVCALFMQSSIASAMQSPLRRFSFAGLDRAQAAQKRAAILQSMKRGLRFFKPQQLRTMLRNQRVGAQRQFVRFNHDPSLIKKEPFAFAALIGKMFAILAILAVLTTAVAVPAYLVTHKSKDKEPLDIKMHTFKGLFEGKPEAAFSEESDDEAWEDFPPVKKTLLERLPFSLQYIKRILFPKKSQYHSFGDFESNDDFFDEDLPPSQKLKIDPKGTIGTDL